MLTIHRQGAEPATSTNPRTEGAVLVASVEFNGYRYDLQRSEIDTSPETRRSVQETFPEIKYDDRVPIRGVPLKNLMRELEREILRLTLVAMNWNKRQTAAAIGVNRTTLIEKLRSRELHPTTADMLKRQGVREDE